MPVFNEANTVEQMILDACQGLGWQFVPGPLRCVQAEESSCPRMARIDANEESPKPFSLFFIRAHSRDSRADNHGLIRMM